MASVTETVVIGGVAVLAIGAFGFLAGKKLEDLGGDLASGFKGAFGQVTRPVTATREAGQGVVTGFKAPSITDKGFFSTKAFLNNVPGEVFQTREGSFVSGGNIIGTPDVTLQPKSVPFNTGSQTGPIQAGNTPVALGMAGRDTFDFLTFKPLRNTFKDLFNGR